jgi:hypothetical protein
MMFRIDGEFTTVRPDTFYGGTRDGGAYEYLFRLPDGRWFLHTINFVTLAEPTFQEISEEQAINWLIRARRIEEDRTEEVWSQQSSRMVPDWVVLRGEEWLGARLQQGGPPPIGLHTTIEIARTTQTWEAITQRQSCFLEPGSVLERLLWPAAAEVSATAGFRAERHDPLIERLQKFLDARLLESPRLSITQSLHDHGADLLIEWPRRAKYGVQLKSNGDVEEKDFPTKTIAQIQDSRQHGLVGLYLILAADITGNSNNQKVRQMLSRISSMNDPYVIAVPPERAWTLLHPSK